MKIIAHRGNVRGRVPEKENHPDFIQQALLLGFDVEIDVWWIDGKYYLGHDEPQYEVDSSFCTQPNVWCHAKNTDALAKLLKLNAHCFWHENDSFTLTSRGIPWCFPENWICGGVTVVFSSRPQVNVPDFVYGICVDNPLEWIKHEIQ